jgi:hypothetical protein
MSNKNYDEATVIKQLSMKHDIRINPNNGVISILRDPKGKSDLGIKSKGKIDFLVNHKGYTTFFTDKF